MSRSLAGGAVEEAEGSAGHRKRFGPKMVAKFLCKRNALPREVQNVSKSENRDSKGGAKGKEWKERTMIEERRGEKATHTSVIFVSA
jgi:hypothetical protein